MAVSKKAMEKDEAVELAVLSETMMKWRDDFLAVQKRKFEVGKALVEECGSAMVMKE